MQKTIILNITPQTHCRATQGDSIFFRIPRDKLKPTGLRRLQRLERYNEYKLCLSAEAKQKKFTLPAAGLSVTFYMPVPPSWSKKKKAQYHGMLHQSSSDIDNLCKAFFDALTSQDKYIANVSLTKRWVDFPTGWIECSVTEVPTQVLIQPPAKE